MFLFRVVSIFGSSVNRLSLSSDDSHLGCRYFSLLPDHVDDRIDDTLQCGTLIDQRFDLQELPAIRRWGVIEVTPHPGE